MTRPRREVGQATLLIVGFAVVLLMAIAVVVDASAAYLQRQGLDNLADGAALAGADAGSRNLAALYGEGVGEQERLEQAHAVARPAVAEYLRRTGAYRTYPGLSYDVAFDAGANSVVVRVRAPVDLPLTVPGGPDTATIGAVGSAAVLTEP